MPTKDEALNKFYDAQCHTLTLAECALILGLGKSTVIQAVNRSGKVMEGVPVIRIGKRKVVSKHAIRDVLGMNKPDAPVAPETENAQEIAPSVSHVTKPKPDSVSKTEFERSWKVAFVDWCSGCDNRTPHIYVRGYTPDKTAFHTWVRCTWCHTRRQGC